MTIETGTTRKVVLVAGLAFKFARNERGRKCNLYEHKLFMRTTPTRKEMLCPSYYCSRNGLLLIARRAKPISEMEAGRLREDDAFPDWDYVPPDELCPFEYKAVDWGRIDGRLVAVDYSATVIG
jgi:hypothetical protein